MTRLTTISAGLISAVLVAWSANAAVPMAGTDTNAERAACGPNGPCAVNNAFFGYYEPRWRQWPCPRPDAAFPSALGNEVIPTPPGTPTVPPPPAPKRAPPAAEEILPPGGFKIREPQVSPPSGLPTLPSAAPGEPGLDPRSIPGLHDERPAPSAPEVFPNRPLVPPTPPSGPPSPLPPGLPLDPQTSAGPATPPYMPPMVRLRAVESRPAPSTPAPPARPNVVPSAIPSAPSAATMPTPMTHSLPIAPNAAAMPAPSAVPPAVVYTPPTAVEYTPPEAASNLWRLNRSRKEAPVSPYAPPATGVASGEPIGQAWASETLSAGVNATHLAARRPSALNSPPQPSPESYTPPLSPNVPLSLPNSRQQSRVTQAVDHQAKVAVQFRGAVQSPVYEQPIQPTSSNVMGVSHAEATAELEGYCPVSLIKSERWVKGNAHWSAVHAGKTYYMSGDVERECFLVDPDRYVPGFGGCDPVTLAEEGRQVPGVLDHCITYNGKLYMFSSANAAARFRQDTGRYLER